MCWWHMATHWQLGVQVQEQTWVLKSQLAEAKFSACALGASMPGKCSASITPPLPALPSRRLPACLPGATAATRWRGEQGKETQKVKTPPPMLCFQPESIQNSLATDFLWLLTWSPLQGALSLWLWQDTQQDIAITNSVLPAPKSTALSPYIKPNTM